MNNPKIFITGSAGLIGSSLYSAFKGEGFVVYGVDCISGACVDCMVDVSVKTKLNQKLNELMQSPSDLPPQYRDVALLAQDLDGKKIPTLEEARQRFF